MNTNKSHWCSDHYFIFAFLTVFVYLYVLLLCILDFNHTPKVPPENFFTTSNLSSSLTEKKENIFSVPVENHTQIPIKETGDIFL